VVKRALEGLKGVERAEVSFRNKEARVRFDPELITVQQLVEVVKRAGFRASVSSPK
jgi:copper chaperone CopZ